MKHKYIFLMIIIPVLYLMSACSDDSTSPSSSKPLLPGKAGSWWKYEKFFLDSNQLRIQDSIEYDSMAVTGTTEKTGKTAGIYSTFISDSPDGPYVKDNDMYFVSEGSKVLAHSSFFDYILKKIPFLSAMPPIFDEQWVTLVDSKDDFWKIINASMSEVELPMDSITNIKLKGTIDITGEKGSVSEYVIGFDKVNTTEFIITLNFDITLTYMNFPINLKPMRILHLYFVEGIGMVKTRLEPFIITVPLVNWTLKFSGEETELRSYHIAK